MGSVSRICLQDFSSVGGRRGEGGTNVDVELFGTAEGEKHLGKEVDGAGEGSGVVGVGDEAVVCCSLKGRIPVMYDERGREEVREGDALD